MSLYKFRCRLSRGISEAVVGKIRLVANDKKKYKVTGRWKVILGD